MAQVMIKILKSSFLAVGVVFFLMACSILYLRYQLKSENQIISDFVRHMDPTPLAVTFRYSKQWDRMGANGFVSLNLDPQKSDPLFSDLDDVFNAFLDDNTSLENSEENNPAITAFSSPVSNILEEAWNGKALTIGSVVQFQPSFLNYLIFFFKTGKERLFDKSGHGFNQLIVENTPTYFQKLLNKYFIQINNIHSDYDPNQSLYKTTLDFFVSDPESFLDSICSEKMDPLDFCGRFLFDRKKIRHNIRSTLFLFHDEFHLKLNVYWKIQGGSLIFSNKKEFINQIFDQVPSKRGENILSNVSSSGDDFLLPEQDDSKYARISFLFDMVQIQNKTIDFFERLKNQSRFISDLTSSPIGEDSFQKIQEQINQLTGYSEKESVTLSYNGEKLISEVRLYSPSSDLFTRDGKEISPEILNSLRMWTAKSVSLGNYSLLRGLFPIPKPVVTRNGKWAIVRSEVLLKSIEPYFKRLGPQIEPNYEVNKL